MGKHVNCAVCGKEHYASFKSCPYCAQKPVVQQALTSPGEDEAPELDDPGIPPEVVAAAAEIETLHGVHDRPTADSLDFGSGSEKYPDPGTTDWTDQGRPDYERHE